tara:strand:+ start:1235 stop:1534 length:300 start_codon:yes stop_codon:yes gene_type:complete
MSTELKKCFSRLIEMYRTGQWDYWCAISCGLTIALEIVNRISDHDHDLIYEDEFPSECLSLAEAAGMDVPAEGIVSNAVLMIVAKKLLGMVVSWLQEVS